MQKSPWAYGLWRLELRPMPLTLLPSYTVMMTVTCNFFANINYVVENYSEHRFHFTASEVLLKETQKYFCSRRRIISPSHWLVWPLQIISLHDATVVVLLFSLKLQSHTMKSMKALQQ